jgi:DNA polymerase I-like protein with 3'-5' exonuclease and polymerase domains
MKVEIDIDVLNQDIFEVWGEEFTIKNEEQLRDFIFNCIDETLYPRDTMPSFALQMGLEIGKKL